MQMVHIPGSCATDRCGIALTEAVSNHAALRLGSLLFPKCALRYTVFSN